MLISRILNISIQGKLALKSLLDGYKFLATPLSDDPIRLLHSQQISDLEKLKSLKYSQYRVPPTLIASNLTKFTSLLINPINLGMENQAKSLILDVHEIIEGNIDESLILMNESGIEEKELRKILCVMRDEGHEICEKIKAEGGLENEGYGLMVYKPYFWFLSTWL